MIGHYRGPYPPFFASPRPPLEAAGGGREEAFL